MGENQKNMLLLFTVKKDIVKTKHDVSDNSSGVRHIYCENNLRNFQCLKTVNNTKAERIFGFVNAHRSRQHCCQFLSEQRKNVV